MARFLGEIFVSVDISNSNPSIMLSLTRLISSHPTVKCVRLGKCVNDREKVHGILSGLTGDDEAGAKKLILDTIYGLPYVSWGNAQKGGVNCSEPTWLRNFSAESVSAATLRAPKAFRSLRPFSM